MSRECYTGKHKGSRNIIKAYVYIENTIKLNKNT